MMEGKAREERKKGIPIPCPVCGCPILYFEGEIDGNAQLNIKCRAKCNGKVRHIKAEYIKKCLTNNNKHGKK